MATIPTPQNQTAPLRASPRPSELPPHGGRPRLWLLALLVVAAVAATGALFIKYKLEALRAAVLETARAKIGAGLEFDTIATDGLRGLRITGLALTVDSGQGPLVSVTAPAAHIYMDLIALLYGEIAINRIQLDRAAIRIERPQGRRWLNTAQGHDSAALALLAAGSYRVLGRDGLLEVTDTASGRGALTLTDFAFDCSKLPDSEQINASFSGLLNGDIAKQVEVKLDFVSLEDFSARARCAELSPQDLSAFLPTSRHFPRSGVMRPLLRVDAYPGANMLVFALQAPLENVAIEEQPEFLSPATGELSVLANYNLNTSVLTFTTARADSNQIHASLEGIISFADDVPVYDLALDTGRFPIVGLLDLALKGRAPEDLQVTLDEPCRIHLELQGTADNPRITGAANAAGGTLVYSPKEKGWPSVSLKLGRIEAAWDPGARQPKGSVIVADGEVSHLPSKLAAQRLAGTVSFADGVFKADTFNGMVTNNPFVASFEYSLADQSAALNVNAQISQLEKSALAHAIKDTALAGEASIRGVVRLKDGRFAFEGDLDLTQALVEHEWWLRKPPGIGARAALSGTFRPASAYAIDFKGDIASSPLEIHITGGHEKDRWWLDEATLTSASLDVVSAAQCLRLPYTISGGAVRDATYHWKRRARRMHDWRAELSASLDEITLLAHGAQTPLKLAGIDINLTLVRGQQSTGNVILKADNALCPPLGQTWFAPLRPPPELQDQFEHVDRDWEYQLAAAQLETPPWKGKEFNAEGFASPKSSGLRRWSAQVEEGRIGGSYENFPVENAYQSSTQWNNIPARYLIEHLELPPVLDGLSTGAVDYALDRDDPASRTGKGSFSVAGGKFSADYLVSFLEGKVADEMALLPPSLRFKKLEAALIFERDIVKTPRLFLDSDSLRLEGAGQFISDGDMDYELRMSIPPDMADRIELLRTYFNIQGHRIAQQNIDLTFHVTGPMFNPQGKLARAPSPSVTLISGGLEVASETIKLIDFPRKILVDLLKVGGGIVGPQGR